MPHFQVDRTPQRGRYPTERRPTRKLTDRTDLGLARMPHFTSDRNGAKISQCQNEKIPPRKQKNDIDRNRRRLPNCHNGSNCATTWNYRTKDNSERTPKNRMVPYQTGKRKQNCCSEHNCATTMNSPDARNQSPMPCRWNPRGPNHVRWLPQRA